MLPNYNSGYFVPDIHCFESLEGVYPPGVKEVRCLGRKILAVQTPCRLFPTQGVSETQAYIPWRDLTMAQRHFVYSPHRFLLAVGAFSNYHH
ncbi:hypothetical protein GTQ43_34420 [Nostoc sp. KVJ3]|uniref:hypothetical protein n=1 Tax=Nostoc sp. KVJ3 TaxID=457945 RepID=UPI0022385A17|nr:hypothetical protein [Nostoc sp. KVJ3]MCW5318606.1 hypothetical protein [Nostoc sp. KVJ3]